MKRLDIPAPGIDWAAAPCTQDDDDRWFPGPTLERDDAYAAALCAGCPLIDACDDLAAHVEGTAPARFRHGVWGGRSTTERARRSRKRRLQPCGTPAAYVRHLDHGEEPRAECRAANAAKSRKRNA